MWKVIANLCAYRSFTVASFSCKLFIAHIVQRGSFFFGAGGIEASVRSTVVISVSIYFYLFYLNSTQNQDHGKHLLTHISGKWL